MLHCPRGYNGGEIGGSSLKLSVWMHNKEYEIEGRYNCRGPPFHTILYNTLQTVLHFYKNYLSDVQLPRMQEPILYILLYFHIQSSQSNESNPFIL